LYFVLLYENVAILIYAANIFLGKYSIQQNDGVEYGTGNCISPAGLLQSGVCLVIVTNIQPFKCWSVNNFVYFDISILTVEAPDLLQSVESKHVFTLNDIGL